MLMNIELQGYKNVNSYRVTLHVVIIFYYKLLNSPKRQIA